MALAKPSITPQHPSFRLQQSLQTFERSLTDAERLRYRSSAPVIGPAGVVAFIGHLDTIKPSRGARDIGARIQSFIGATEQFTSVVDSFVGAGGDIGALVWGSIKLSFLIFNNILGYRDAVSEIVLQLGRQCPTIAEFGKIHESSVGVQEALCDYYAAVIDLCSLIVAASRRSATWQGVRSIFTPATSEFSSNIKAISTAASHVHDRCSVARDAQEAKAHQSAKNFQNESLLEQRRSADWRMGQKASRKADLIRSICKNLSTLNTQSIFYSVLCQRSPGTTQWFQDDSDFQAWLSEPRVKALWTRGTLGTGKTVLMASMCEYVTRSSPSGSFVCQHFCQPDRPATLAAKEVIGHLLRQLIHPYLEGTSTKDLETLEKATTDFVLADLLSLRHVKQISVTPYFVLLDGVDHCTDSDRDAILQGIEQLRTMWPDRMGLIISGQPDLGQYVHRAFGGLVTLSLGGPESKQDIESYATMALRQKIDNGCVRFESQDLERDVLLATSIGSDGMFLWAQLFLEDVCAQLTDYDVRLALVSPPRGITELVDRILKRVRTQPSSLLVLRFLGACATVLRPLTVDEYKVFLSVEEGQDRLDEAKLINCMERLVGRSRGLAYVNEEQQTVHMVHHSVARHLLTEEGLSVAYDQSHHTIGTLCLTYLNFSNFKQQVAINDAVGKAVLGAPALIGLQSLRSLVPDVADALGPRLHKLHLKSLQGVRYHSLQQRLPQRPANSSIQHVFLDYANTHWTEHMKRYQIAHSVSGTDWAQRQLQQLRYCLEDRRNLQPERLRGLCGVHGGLQRLSTISSELLRWTLEQQWPILIQAILYLGQDDLPLESTENEIIQVAVQKRGFPLLLTLLHHTPRLGIKKLKYALDCVINASNVEALRCVFEGVFALTDTRRIGELLSYAIDRSASAACRPIIQHIVNTTEFNSNPHATISDIAMVGAVAIGDVDIMCALLKAGGNASAVLDDRDWTRTALQVAATCGHHAIVNLLLTHGATVHRVNRMGWSALYGAAFNGHADIFLTLLQEGADVRTTPLKLWRELASSGRLTSEPILDALGSSFAGDVSFIRSRSEGSSVFL